MPVTVQPPLSQWQPSSGLPADLPALAAVVNERAGRLGTARLSGTLAVVATGHQPWLWHPGILAKYVAAAGAASQWGGQALHLVVDQDVHPALELEVPQRNEDRLSVHKVTLGLQDARVPAACQPPADPRHVQQALSKLRGEAEESVVAGLERLRAAFTDLPECENLAEQLAVVLTRLMARWAGAMPLVFATDLAKLASFQGLMQRMQEEAGECVSAYNQAAGQFPAAGIASLAIEERRVELPLWALAWQQPRRRVFATRGQAARLVLENGEPANPATLAPRALLLTAFARQRLCNFFIHGRGGGAYEPVGEAWWSQWTGTPLAPMAVVSADVYLGFDAPVAETSELRRAQWLAHHLPHNVDRVLGLDGPLIKEKRTLLNTMNMDRDRGRRFAAFQQLHRINKQLASEHPEAIEGAGRQLARARAGVANRRIAGKRDWCLALYADQELKQLAQELGL